MKYLSVVAFLVACVPFLCHGEGTLKRPDGETPAGVEALSPELRKLLTREMVELQNGMVAIVPLYVSGRLDEISIIARDMENSYVLKKNLAKAQIHELHSKLPRSFLELDEQFHYFAGMLEHAASIGKMELVGFYISKMNETCARCHAAYAVHRFPAFISQKKINHDH